MPNLVLRRRRWIPVTGLLPAVALVVGVSAEPAPPQRANEATRLPATAAELFKSDTIWTAHFTVAADQWALMEPKPMGPGDTPRNGVAGNLLLNEVHADLEFAGKLFKDIGLRFKGNGTLLNSVLTKMPLKADLNQFVKGQKLADLSILNFHNNIWDPTATNETLAYGLFRTIGVPAPRVTYARVYLTVPGKYDRLYSGLYSVVEDIDNNFAAERFGTRDGAIFKPSSTNFFSYRGTDWANYQREWDPKSDLTDAQKARVIDFVSFACFATDAEFAAHIGTFVDVDNFARQMAGAVWVSNLDGPPANGQNLYMYLDPRTNRFITIPWDQDDAWGGIFQTQDVRNTVNIFKPWTNQHSFISRVFGLSAFQQVYRETLATIALGPGRSETLIKQQADLAVILRPAVREESETALGLFDGGINETMVPRTFAGVFGAHGPHLTLREFARARERAVIEQLLTGR